MTSPAKWHSPALEGRIARADQASSDIKSFNEYVNLHGLRARVEFAVPGTGERLIWYAVNGRSDWGLAYQVGTNTTTVLIECKMEIRLRMAKLLPAMLAAIDRAVEREEAVNPALTADQPMED